MRATKKPIAKLVPAKLPAASAGGNPVAAADARSRFRQRADNYLVAADAPATVRAYTADWKHFSVWCLTRGLIAIPARPDQVGDYLADLGEGYARATLRRNWQRSRALVGSPATHSIPATPPSATCCEGSGALTAVRLNGHRRWQRRRSRSWSPPVQTIWPACATAPSFWSGSPVPCGGRNFVQSRCRAGAL